MLPFISFNKCQYIYFYIMSSCPAACFLGNRKIYLRSSGSTLKSEVAKLAGNKPSPLWLNPFHQLGSLKKKKRTLLKFMWQLHIKNKHQNKYSWLSLSRIPRDLLKHFKISVPQHIRVERVRKIINWTTTFNKWICNLTPEVRNIYIKYIYKIMWKKGEIAP